MQHTKVIAMLLGGFRRKADGIFLQRTKGILAGILTGYTRGESDETMQGKK